MLRLILALFLFSTSAAAAQECLRLEVSGDVRLTGEVLPEGYECFVLSVPPGQNLSTEVIEGRNIIVSVLGYFDARAERTYFGDIRAPIELRVGQLMRSVMTEPYVVLVRFEPPGNG